MQTSSETVNVDASSAGLTVVSRHCRSLPMNQDHSPKGYNPILSGHNTTRKHTYSSPDTHQILNDKNASSGASSFSCGFGADDVADDPTAAVGDIMSWVPFVVRVCGTSSDVEGLYPGAIRFIASFLKHRK